MSEEEVNRIGREVTALQTEMKYLRADIADLKAQAARLVWVVLAAVIVAVLGLVLTGGAEASAALEHAQEETASPHQAPAHTPVW